MAFRADEAAQANYHEAENYLIPRARDASEAERQRSKDAFADIVDRCGPVIDSYPTWHPLVRNHNAHSPQTLPSDRCGYKGLDHTRYFVNGFITCPYGDGQEVIDSVNDLHRHHVASITAEKLDVQFYNPTATPILVTCNWEKPLPMDRMIPLSIAMPLILEQELPCWRWSEVAETWETMRSYFLGNPHGSRSSLFVNQETGQAIKKVWNALIYTGMFGPIKV
ncbi:hypothetical protein CAP48_12455 [Advenella sp. S44]|uniref:hypothetical protein n=1 Tax=Advenella sp. S44 TaxID=1982755 RepID=UPI000C2ACAAA|nr:hypothetical protein [Advenella sp. S44]PJX23355.1 hypothetical protein CAP48_12455 [Advenella sp. S44]